MPTYDYECEACQHKFEHFQGINDPLLKKCPECKKPKLKRLFGTGAALMFKGSGFYTTDYRSESYKQKAAAETKANESSSAPASDSKSETKSSSSDAASSSTPAASPAKSSPKKQE